MTKRLWQYRRFIISCWLLLTLAGGAWLALEFRVDNSVGVWFSEKDPALQTYKQYLEDWGEREWTMAMITVDDARDSALRPKLQELVTQLEDQEGCHKVLSVATLPHGHPLSEKLFLRPDDPQHTLLLLQTDNFFQRQDPYRGEMLQQIENELQAASFIEEYHIVGTSVVNAQLNQAAIFDMVLFFCLVSVLLTLSSLWLMRSWRDTVVLLAIALSTVSLTLGLICVCGYSLNIVTIMLPTILIALSTADAVHMIQAFHTHRQDMPSIKAATTAVSELWLPCLGTTITTVAGFMSLAGSPVLPVFQLAVFCSFGITCAWLVSVLVAPLLLVHLWPESGVQVARARREERIVSWLQMVIARPVRVLLTFVLLCTVLGGLIRLKADTNYVNFFRSDSAIPKSYEKVDKVGFPQSPLVVVLDRQASKEAHAQFISDIEKLPQVRNVVAPAPGLSEMLELVSVDGQQQRMFVLTSYLGSQDLLKLVERIRKLQQKYLPETNIAVTGTTMLWANMDTSVVATQKRSLLIIAPLMLLVLCLLFKSLTLGMIGWILSCLPVAMILGLMGFLGIEINIATVLIAGVTLGLAVDDAIHLIFAFQEKRRMGMSSEAATTESLRSSGTRILLTTLIVMSGFACMGVSSFNPTANFGILTCLTIGIAALFDLTLLPLILQSPLLGGTIERQEKQIDAGTITGAAEGSQGGLK